MNLGREPAAIASSAAEEIRALNHRTIDPGGFPMPGDVSDTANALASLVERLPQTLQQLAAGLRELEEEQAIRMDDGSDVGESVSGVLRSLLSAQEALSAARGSMREAAGRLSHMGGFFAEEEPADA